MLDRALRWLLIILNGFLALTAFAGGIGLLADLNAPPLETLEGSIFRSFLIPGLALFLVVGGSALTAAVLHIRRHALAGYSGMAAGLIIIAFEIVEVMVIGSDQGVARMLQIFYASLGLAILLFSSAKVFITKTHVQREGVPS